MTTEEKDAEIERLRKRIADLERASNLPRVEEIQGVYREAKLESEIERLNAQLLEILNLKHKGLTGGEWILKAHKAEEEVDRLKGELEHVKFLCGPDESGKNVFEREHALKGELAESVAVLKPFVDVFRESEERYAAVKSTWYEEMPGDWPKEIKVTMADCRSARAFLQKHTPPLNCGSAAAGESPSHSGGGECRSAWLVENGKSHGDGLKYLAFDPSSGMFEWVDGVDDALQLSRRQDAELIAQECEEAQRIVEHQFHPEQNLTGKSALREVPPQEGAGVDARKSQEGSTPSLPANHEKGEV